MANLRTTRNVKIVKNDIEKESKVLQELGINMSEFINITIKLLILQNGMPFDISIPINELAYTQKYADEYKNYNNIID